MAELDRANIPVGADIADVQITYNNGLSLSGRLYTQQDGSLGIIDTYTYEVYGIITFTYKTAMVQGCYLDGTYEILSNE